MGGEQLCFYGVRRFPVSSTESEGLVQQEPAIGLVCVESWPASAFEIFLLQVWPCDPADQYPPVPESELVELRGWLGSHEATFHFLYETQRAYLNLNMLPW